MCVCPRACVFVHVCMCMCVCMCVCACMCVCVNGSLLKKQDPSVVGREHCHAILSM